ncbi:MAG: universal stress protein, partial [Myxococcota bacterium]
ASHGGLARLVLGSVPSSLIRAARCPVLVVNDRRPGPDNLTRVMATIDMSPISRNVLHNAVVSATAMDGQVRVLSLFEPPILRPDPEGWLPKYLSPDELEEVAAHRFGEVSALIRRSVPRNAVPIEVEVQGRQPAPDGILQQAKDWQADMLVIGTSGHNAWHRMILGSTTHDVLLRAMCPVMVV